jgi:hypothetical protein
MLLGFLANALPIELKLVVAAAQRGEDVGCCVELKFWKRVSRAEWAGGGAWVGRLMCVFVWCFRHKGFCFEVTLFCV